MKIKSAKSFRKWYKELIPARKKNPDLWNENFMGTLHDEESGFLQMYHGDKEDIYGFLRKEVEMAEDGQAIYEFVQNAADSDSTKFYMFYDENYLIVLNNGIVFSKEGVKSILNIGQSFGKQDPDKIGRYGIGFKLVHRLVGKSSGLDELLNGDKQGYRGPILFSWSEKSQFSEFLSTDKFEYVGVEDNQAPWLFKILITNFPTQLEEQVKDINFTDIKPFQSDELKAFQAFLNKCSEQIDLNSLDNGTIFFLKLGDKKFEYLERQKQEYLNGLSTSMHFLKSLDTLVINENVVNKDTEAINVLEFIVENDSDEFNEIGLTEIRDKESDAKFKICFADNAKSAIEIKKHPNIYKYFPAVKEVNNLSFVIHSNLFELSSNRQNLTETPINKNLLGLLAKKVINKMEAIKFEDRNTFNNLFTSILMSEESSNNFSGNGWQSDYYYNILLGYIQKTIPTKGIYFSSNPQNVKVNKLNSILNIDLADFGLSHIEWFEWDNDLNELLIEEAKKENKLGIVEWDIRDLIENAHLESINDWIVNCDEQTYRSFLHELSTSDLRIPTRIKLCNVKLFQFSDNKKYSLFDITGHIINRFDGTSGNYRFYKSGSTKPDYIFHSEKTSNIDSEIRKLNFNVCDFEIAKYMKIFFNDKWNVYYYNELQKESTLYNWLAEKCKTNKLLPDEKKNIFINLINESTKFDNISEGALKKIELFCNNDSAIKPLNKLIGNINTPSWLNKYKLKVEEYFPELNQFLISDPEDVFKEIYQQNQNDIIAEITTAAEIKSLIKLYQENQKSFFKEFIIKIENNEFVIIEKTIDTYQVQSADKESRRFLEENCYKNLFVLPYDFLEYKDEEGVIKADDLYNLILEFVDVNENKETLVDIVKYKAKHKFLQELSEFRFNSNAEYNKENFGYKILELACSEFKENDLEIFKEKVIIEAENKDIKLSVIPPLADIIRIETYEISLAKILPNNYENSNHLSGLINQFIGLGLNKERITNLFGISDEPDPIEIFQIFTEQVEVLDNAEQLAFLFLYGLNIEEIDFGRFKALNIEEEEIKLGTDKYLTEFDFIQKSEILHNKYNAITKIFKKFPIVVEDNENLLLLDKPYFQKDRFICPHIKENLSDEQKLCFVEFLFNQWNTHNIGATINSIDWSKIDDIETENILGFNPRKSVYPSNYACESEILPDYIIKWIGKEESKIDFLSNIGVWTDSSVIVELRKYLSGEINDFNKKRLTKEPRFFDDETNLFNSFIWIQENEIIIKTLEQLEAFKKVVEVINENRALGGYLIINEVFDFEELNAKSIEWAESYYENWKKNSDFTIFLFPGELPKLIILNEVELYVFYTFFEGNIAVDDENNIYINKNSDVKKELRKLELEEDSVLNFEGLWHNKLEELEKENTLLRKSTIATLGSEFSTDISKNEQKEANREAKEIVKEKLEIEGFEFTEGIGNFSTINGVFKDEIEFPLVVKSYKYPEEPLKIGANEWIQLMKPNSMFWLHYGNRKLACLKLYELLRNQDKITVSFSTENLDIENRLVDFAELLHYFRNVHFDFNSISPSDYSLAKDFSDYRFDERRYEQDLSGDDEDILK